MGHFEMSNFWGIIILIITLLGMVFLVITLLFDPFKILFRQTPHIERNHRNTDEVVKAAMKRWAQTLCRAGTGTVDMPSIIESFCNLRMEKAIPEYICKLSLETLEAVGYWRDLKKTPPRFLQMKDDLMTKFSNDLNHRICILLSCISKHPFDLSMTDINGEFVNLKGVITKWFVHIKGCFECASKYPEVINAAFSEIEKHTNTKVKFLNQAI